MDRMHSMLEPRTYVMMLAATLLTVAMGTPVASQANPAICYDQDGTPYLSVVDSDMDGSPDCEDPDDDNDAISDRLEDVAGTNSRSTDSDGDRIKDVDDLVPTQPGPNFALEVGVQHLQALDECGDGDLWDPYFDTLVLNVPASAVPYNTVAWSRSNHPMNYNGSSGVDLPSASAAVPADANRWDLFFAPFPWSSTSVGMFDDDGLNADDPVHLKGPETEVVTDPLAIAQGVSGVAMSGTGTCKAGISFGTNLGIGPLQQRIVVEHLVRGKNFIDCEDVGMSADCGAPDKGTEGVRETIEETEWFAQQTREYVQSTIGDTVEDLPDRPRPGSLADRAIDLYVFLAEGEPNALDVDIRLSKINGDAIANVTGLTVPPGKGAFAYSVPLDDVVIVQIFDRSGPSPSAGLEFALVRLDFLEEGAVLGVLLAHLEGGPLGIAQSIVYGEG